MNDEKEETWLHGLGFVVIACWSVGAIMVIELIWKAQNTVVDTFRKLRNKMSSEDKKETVQEEKKETVILPVFDPMSLVGQKKEDAETKAQAEGFKTRITVEDGKSPMMGDMMMDMSRLKFEIEKGIVVKVSKG